VIIGYGKVKKSDATGSLTTVKIDEENDGNPVTAQDALRGKAAGVNIISPGVHLVQVLPLGSGRLFFVCK
jgi:iron complex outermembrane receptor protein